MIIYFLYLSLTPLLFLIIFFSKFFNKKIFIRLKNEKKIFRSLLENIDYTKKILIFHAASAGEFQQLKPILKTVDRDKYYIIQSFMSPTIYEQEKTSKLFDACCYHPFDFLFSSYIFFKKLKPYRYVITRHDLWPNHILVCNFLKIPIYFINANIHKNSIWKKSFLFSFSKFIFQKIDYIFVPSKRIQNNLLCFNTNTIVTGDSRFDQILERKENNKILLPDQYSKTQNIIFGSYDYIDEEMILLGLSKSFPNGDKDLRKKNISIILVPHEIKKIEKLSRKLSKIGFNACLYSDNLEYSSVLIVDTVGILADLYKLCIIAYVGGGFTRGVHSVIEPAVYNCIIGYGPNYEMLDEAVYMIKNDLSIKLSNKNDFQSFIELIYNIDKKEKMKTELSYFIKSFSGSTKKIVKGLSI